MPGPYQRTWDLVRANLGRFGLLLVANIVFIMLFQAVYTMVILPFVVVILVLQIVLVPLVFMTGVWGAIAVPIILLLTGFMMAVRILFACGVQGWNVYLARKVLDIRKGYPIDLAAMLKELKMDWKYYFRKGAGIVAFVYIIVSPILTAVLIVPLFIVIALGMAMVENPMAPLFIAIIFMMVYVLVMVLVTPAIQFIMDAGSVRIAQGTGAWRGLFGAVRDMFRRRRLFGWYYLSMFILSMAMMVLFPIAMFVQWALPIATRTFIVANDDL